MKKIEQAMFNAVVNRISWQKDNTQVTIDEKGRPTVFLHGNRIAYPPEDTPEKRLRIDLETLDRWPTRTTLSRLRALGFQVWLVKGMPVVALPEIII